MTRNRKIAHRTKGTGHGGITRLASPGDLGGLIKPFVFLDHFESDGRRAPTLPWHPHSGIATHTTLLDGEITYADSTGKSGTLSQGSIEYMQAGGGVWHTGGLVPGKPVRGFQLWIALPEEDEMAPPRSLYIPPSAIPEVGSARVLLGTYEGHQGPISYSAAATYLHVRLQEGQRWRFQPDVAHDVAWLAVSRGELAIGSSDVGKELVVFDAGHEAVEVQARSDAEFVIGSAQRHPHALVLGSYSVHSSEERLRAGESRIQDIRAQLGEVG